LIELEGHPFFTACQYHPEFLSRPGKPHPLFRGLIEAAQLRRGEGVAQDRPLPADGVPLQV
jgi:CTP synthase